LQKKGEKKERAKKINLFPTCEGEKENLKQRRQLIFLIKEFNFY